MLTAETFRMGGHATHDEREAREVIPAEMFVHWGRRDPIGLFEEYLKQTGTPAAVLEKAEAEVAEEVEQGADEALRSRDENMPVPESALDGVYAGEKLEVRSEKATPHPTGGLGGPSHFSPLTSYIPNNVLIEVISFGIENTNTTASTGGIRYFTKNFHALMNFGLPTPTESSCSASGRIL